MFSFLKNIFKKTDETTPTQANAEPVEVKENEISNTSTSNETTLPESVVTQSDETTDTQPEQDTTEHTNEQSDAVENTLSENETTTESSTPDAEITSEITETCSETTPTTLSENESHQIETTVVTDEHTNDDSEAALMAEQVVAEQNQSEDENTFRQPKNDSDPSSENSNNQSASEANASQNDETPRSSWASPTAAVVKPSVPAEEPTEESVGEKVTHWTQGMVHAVHDKADELEMRAEIVAEESSQTIKSWASHAEHWVEGMAHAVKDKVDELEMRAEIVANETAHAIEESIDAIEHAVISDAPPRPELLDEDAEPEVQAPPPADAATDIDEIQHQHTAAHISTKEPIHVPTDAPIVAAESATVFTGDDELANSWAARLARGLSKSRNQMAKSLAGVFGGGRIDDDLYEELETVLLTSDMGIEATQHLMQEVRDRVSLKGLKDGNELRQALKDAIYDLIKPLEQPLEIPNNGQPFVIMMAGINGAGKTTSIGKLAKYFQSQGKTVMLAAGDTFRAAAREQLQEWGARNGVTVVSQASGDSAAVCFDAVESAKAKKIDIVLADTAGRLPTQLHLMEEIKKVKRVLQKAMPDAPHEIIVVLDANIGQNAINQVVAFDDALGVTGLIVTKLDGTAKGGILAALASSRAIPVRYIGVGESIDDLRPFNARAFVDALLDEQKNQHT